MGRVSKQPEQRRQEILDAAARLFSKNGFGQTTVSDIVREVGVAQGLFYYYFKNKEEVMVAVMLEYAKAFIETVEHIIQDQSASPIDRIRRVATQIPKILYSRDAFYVQIPEANRQEALNQFLRMTADFLWPHVTMLIEEGVGDGYFHVTHANYTAKFLLTGFVGLSVGAPHIAADEMMVMIFELCERVLGLPCGTLWSGSDTVEDNG